MRCTTHCYHPGLARKERNKEPCLGIHSARKADLPTKGAGCPLGKGKPSWRVEHAIYPMNGLHD